MKLKHVLRFQIQQIEFIFTMKKFEKLDKSILDLDYYRKLIEKNKFTDRKVVSWELDQNI